MLFVCPKGGDIINKYEKEVELAKLKEEEKELKQLKAIYNKASDDIAKKLKISNGKINVLLKDFDELDDVQKSILQSQIYQRNFQLSLKKQIDGFLSDLQTDQYKSIDEYLKGCYETGFLGSMYDLHGQGIPLVMPIDQKQVTKAIKLDPKISKNLYTKLGEDVGLLKKRIANNVSRGIATASEYKVIARNIAADSNVGFNRAMRIARTEGHGVQVQAAVDVQHKAKEKGADIVKQWDAALDGRTRESHRRVDGEIRELDEKFSNGMMHPSDPAGGAAEVVNCRCALLQRARWALDEDELETLKERAKYYGLDKTKDFDDFKAKYLKAASENKYKLLSDIEGTELYDEIKDRLENYVGGGYGSVKEAINDDEMFKYILDSMTNYDGKLYRIEEADFTLDTKNLKEGHIFSFDDNVRSFTRDKKFIDNVLDDFSDIDFDNPVVFETVGKAKHLNMDKFATNYYEYQAESLVGGKFEVVGIKNVVINGKQVTKVKIKQIINTNNKSPVKSTTTKVVEKVKKPAFIPAKTIEEAEDHIKKFVDSSGFGATGISYKGISVESANAVNEALEKLYDRFNMDKLGGVYVAKGNTKLGKTIDSATAAYSPIRNSLLINNQALKNPDVFLKSRKEELEIIKKYKEDPSAYTFKTKRAEDVAKASLISGRATVPDTVEDVINHEMGHSIEKMVAKADGYDTVKANMSKYAEKISGYATINEAEYIAESFASYLKGEGLIDPNLEKIFKGLERNG